MDFARITDALQKGLDFAEKVAPTISELTPYGNVAAAVVQAVSAITEVAKNIQDRIDEGILVASSTDQEAIRAITERLHALNDELARQIDAS